MRFFLDPSGRPGLAGGGGGGGGGGKKKLSIGRLKPSRPSSSEDSGLGVRTIEGTWSLICRPVLVLYCRPLGPIT